ncbi:NAD(P)-dependent dehydrogenase (short-subunit alcohol dehydrogenase family) [Crossiella equi]|uniref:NAD(P)-dependent dehydrogenase (Short-subunit alcohol dehydrogenase family) n=1 Tax=Crossiella equi TaxID=130796 RepID=A0ABS5ANV7_9PSEU|nr:SDR family NAD(P)-dependent oxidoreductase [Crossiella equi]MBP2478258.1 NAD(P)-dependent dehydrogenase (short-subunit alcohol dehydrogenase family) [Crossiella equi]
MGTKTIVISGGTSGMGRATALARLRRGDRVHVIGSDPAKGRALEAEANSSRLTFLHADLTSVEANRRVLAQLPGTVDALLLFANRVSPHRRETAEGLEQTFALYYLSRYLLARGLAPALDRAPDPVIVSVAGVGTTAGAIQWEDLQLTRGYGLVRAQLQAGRANDLLGVAFAEERVSRARFVLYHPGFTRSGDHSPLNPVLRALLKLTALAARPVAKAVEPIHGFIDSPPRSPLAAVDRGKTLDLSLPTLDPATARRLAEVTGELLSGRSR